MKIQIAALFAFCVALTPIPAAAAPTDVFGVWLTKDGTGHVEIAPCGQSACGTVIWGEPGSGSPTDDKNPNPALRSRQIIGLRILDNFTRSRTGWVNGRIYDPKSGNTYRSEIAVQPNGALNVKGCIAPLLCRTDVWRRVR